MSDVTIHPTLGIAVRSDGAVCVLDRYTRKFHWFYGADDGSGYMKVKIRNKNYRVHRIILEAFVGECPEGFECDHKDRNRSNNRVENLRWASRRDNQRNTKSNDRVESRGGTHTYEDKAAYNRESMVRCRKNNPSVYRAINKRWSSSHEDYVKQYREKWKTKNRCVRFSDGIVRSVTIEQALELLKLPVKERIYDKI